MSKNLQGLVNKNTVPRDLKKMEMMTNNWTSEGSFEQVTPTAGLFQHKQTNEFIFESKKKLWWDQDFDGKTWTESEMVQDLSRGYAKREIELQNLLREKDWNKLFFKIDAKHTQLGEEFMGALAEIVDVNYVNQGVWVDGTSVLMASVLYSHSKAVEILLKRKANIEWKDEYGSTALHWATRRKSIDVMEILLKFGANIDATDVDLETPLMCAACLFVNTGIFLEFLLNKGAKTSPTNKKGQTALDLARKFTHREGNSAMIKLLEDQRYKDF